MPIDSHTRLYGVLGDPVAHSLSPIMHTRAFSHLGVNAVFLAFRVSDIEGAVRGMRALGIQGVSVTIPHKQSVMAFLDEVDELAARIGAVNTVIHRDGTLFGCNTDAWGAITALSEKTPLKNRYVVVLGAGGAARAIGFGALREGARVTIVNRTVDKGERLSKDIGAEFLPLAEVRRIEADVLINTTSVGMKPAVDTTPIDPRFLHGDMIVMDIVYNPMKTRLLGDAEKIGCTTIDGTVMFVHQGAKQFELWTGMPAPVALMRQTVIGALGGQGA